MTEFPRARLDEVLVAQGLAPSRSRARDMIRRGTVTVDGAAETRPARMVRVSAQITVRDPAKGYVSRAALKLIAGLDGFGYDPVGRTILDLGASTGGFTQVLLERGAEHVISVDVGNGEMDASLAADPRVTPIEGLNARHLERAHLGGRPVEAITADLSFISLKLALPAALSLGASGAWGVFLVKPQFEVGRTALGKGGVVRDPELARETADALAAWLDEQDGWRVEGLLPSPLAGGSGNQEFLLGARRD
jgi:23S rRNA (cytidine1920-2'-O)/16S rRNA (cytidine1409-2'-O)-methyltransferase